MHAMLRSSLSRPLLKRIAKTCPSANGARTSIIHSPSIAKRRPAINIKPLVAKQQYASGPPYDKIDSEAEAKIAAKRLEPHPDQVSTESSVGHVSEQKAQAEKADEAANMGGGLKNDLKTIRDTFALNEVPRDSYYLGAAGVIPYAATSLSTVYLCYDIGHAQENLTNGILISPETAYQLLKIIEPVQVGYGAVIISFLGAIHWGLEYAEYGGRHGYRRYAIGVAAPAVAWPTLLMPIETALTVQFLAFNMLYFADARASMRGWCPPWYATYRFVLTFFVGASIVFSLIGRGQIMKVSADTDGKLHFEGLGGPVKGMQKLRDQQWENLESDEKREREMAKNKEEDEEEEEEAKAAKEKENRGKEEGDEKDGGKEKDDDENGEKEDEKKDEKKDDKKDEKKDEKK